VEVSDLRIKLQGMIRPSPMEQAREHARRAELVAHANQTGCACVCLLWRPKSGGEWRCFRCDPVSVPMHDVELLNVARAPLPILQARLG